MEELQINQELNEEPEWMVILRKLYEEIIKEKDKSGEQNGRE